MRDGGLAQNMERSIVNMRRQRGCSQCLYRGFRKARRKVPDVHCIGEIQQGIYDW